MQRKIIVCLASKAEQKATGFDGIADPECFTKFATESPEIVKSLRTAVDVWLKPMGRDAQASRCAIWQCFAFRIGKNAACFRIQYRK